MGIRNWYRSFFRAGKSKHLDLGAARKDALRLKKRSARNQPAKDTLFDGLTKAGRFPWAKPVREIKRKNFALTLYADGSRLYAFKGGQEGHLILTPEGTMLLRANPGIIRRYLKGEKIYLTSGGNSDIQLMTASQRPIVVKEHLEGINAQTQIEHQRQIRRELTRTNSIHDAPVQYGAMNLSAQGRVRSLSIMEYIAADKVSEILERLEARAEQGDAKAMKEKNKLHSDFKSFKARLTKLGLPLTDFHEGNVLARYDKNLQRYVFTILDQ